MVCEEEEDTTQLVQEGLARGTRRGERRRFVVCLDDDDALQPLGSLVSWRQFSPSKNGGHATSRRRHCDCEERITLPSSSSPQDPVRLDHI